MSASRTTRRLVAALLATGALVGAAALPASADDRRDHGRHQQARSAVVLGDIQYDSPGRDTRSNRSLNAEWVDVTNNGRRAVDLDGWTLTNRDGDRYHFDNLRLAGHSTVRVHTGHGRDTRRDVYQDRSDYVWDDRSDTATLRNDNGRTVDTDSWGRGHHNNGRTDGTDFWGRDHHNNGRTDGTDFWGRDHHNNGRTDGTDFWGRDHHNNGRP
ncbi:lamin tail domain-containing protein [Streptomyces sp. NBC_01142]|uniref:lamin tail domain-containing protein n=1 Tax=Streptomyces sp. NBC_01142 TaxID=2975865 RepID=UPI00225501CD|nr:lamin tail domain-containing protein [Streptomyces sp. NBC_01142]MCX4825612.1 lamin tail domain-containing protein [Streptomyces sp. NBC_01142]